MPGFATILIALLLLLICVKSALYIYQTAVVHEPLTNSERVGVQYAIDRVTEADPSLNGIHSLDLAPYYAEKHSAEMPAGDFMGGDARILVPRYEAAIAAIANSSDASFNSIGAANRGGGADTYLGRFAAMRNFVLQGGPPRALGEAVTPSAAGASAPIDDAVHDANVAEFDRTISAAAAAITSAAGKINLYDPANPITIRFCELIMDWQPKHDAAEAAAAQAREDSTSAARAELARISSIPATAEVKRARNELGNHVQLVDGAFNIYVASRDTALRDLTQVISDIDIPIQAFDVSLAACSEALVAVAGTDDDPAKREDFLTQIQKQTALTRGLEETRLVDAGLDAFIAEIETRTKAMRATDPFGAAITVFVRAVTALEPALRAALDRSKVLPLPVPPSKHSDNAGEKALSFAKNAAKSVEKTAKKAGKALRKAFRV